MIESWNRKRSQRRGAAFFLLVVLILLVVVGATESLVRGELTARRAEAARLRVSSMQAAIDAALRNRDTANLPIVFPVNPSRRETVEVAIDADQTHIIARWIRGDRAVDQMKRVIEANSETEE